LNVKGQRAFLSVAAAAVAGTLGSHAARAQAAGVTLSPQAQQEIAQVEAEIDRIEAQTAERLAKPPDNQVQQVELLGKLIVFDKQLSVTTTRLACSAICPRPASPVRCRN
jgi:hypothetical protein